MYIVTQLKLFQYDAANIDPIDIIRCDNLEYYYVEKVKIVLRRSN